MTLTGLLKRTQFITALLCSASAALAAEPHDERWFGKEKTTEWESARLGAKLVVLPGVFPPFEAETQVLPLMGDHPGLFAGKSVLEIGTGSGIISLYAAKLGAVRIVATDISEAAVAAAIQNAERLGFSATIETRLVPPCDMSAYSVIEPGETFDVIISNPPYALDLDAPENSPLTDRGDLGLSIVRGLGEHLTPDGVAVLFYGSLFYHQVMAKFARYEGFHVRSHLPRSLVPWEARTIFNAYLARLLEAEKLEPDSFRFNKFDLNGIAVREQREKPLLAEANQTRYPGFIAIKRIPGAKRASRAR